MLILPDVKPEDIKEVVEVPTEDAKKYEALGWVIIDTYKTDRNFTVLAWVKNDPPAKP
jgi:hypothetical protein